METKYKKGDKVYFLMQEQTGGICYTFFRDLVWDAQVEQVKTEIIDGKACHLYDLGLSGRQWVAEGCIYKNARAAKLAAQRNNIVGWTWKIAQIRKEIKEQEKQIANYESEIRLAEAGEKRKK